MTEIEFKVKIPDWITKCDYNLVTQDSFNACTSVIREGQIISLDLETTGLNTEKDQIVGISISIKSSQAYYFPVGHEVNAEQNLPWEPVKEFIQSLADEGKVFIFYNQKFDREFLRNAGVIIRPHPFCEEVMVGPHLYDPNSKSLKLKTVSKIYLRIEPIELVDLFPEVPKGKKKDIQCKNLSPSQIYQYACQDADLTLRIHQKFNFQREDTCKVIWGMEQYLIDELIKLENNRFKLDIPLLKLMQESSITRTSTCEKEIYKYAKREFNINSTLELGKVLYETLKIKCEFRTEKKGQPKTDDTTLKTIIDKHPIVSIIQDYRSLVKINSTYLTKLIDGVNEKDEAKFAFMSLRVPTGRLAASSGGKGSGYSALNIHSLPKAEAAVIVEAKLIPNKIEGEIPTGELLKSVQKKEKDIVERKLLPNSPFFEQYGKHYCLIEDCSNCPHRCEYVKKLIDISSEINVRSAFIAREGYTIVSIDFSNEELRVAANLSKEPEWLKAFIRGEDLHWKMAQLLFKLPPEPIVKEKRKIAKICNFLTLFGGGPPALASQAGIPIDEAKQIQYGFFKPVPVLEGWIKTSHQKAITQGYIETFFRRRRPIPEARSTDPKIKAFGLRTSVNHQVQGTCADIMKITLTKIGRLIREKWGNDVRLLLNIHDELVFEIKTERLDEIVPELIDKMTFRVPGWIPITCEASVGESWGITKTWENKKVISPIVEESPSLKAPASKCYVESTGEFVVLLRDSMTKEDFLDLKEIIKNKRHEGSKELILKWKEEVINLKEKIFINPDAAFRMKLFPFVKSTSF